MKRGTFDDDDEADDEEEGESSGRSSCEDAYSSQQGEENVRGY